MSRLAPLAVLLAVIACVQPPRYDVGTVDQAALAAELALQETALRETLQRVNQTFSPLVVAGVPLCDDTTPFYGFSLSPSEPLRVREVGPGTPADQAGLLSGDKIAAVSGEIVTTRAERNRSRARARPGQVWRPLPTIEAALAGRATAFRVLRDGAMHNLTIQPETRCAYGVRLLNSEQVTAYADGTFVYVTRGMVEFVQSDAELQFVMAHELAHNAARHLEAAEHNAEVGSFWGALAGAVLDAATGTRTNTRRGTRRGGQAGVVAYGQDFEREADYLGAYFLARGGIALDGLEDFWRRMAEESGYQSLRPNPNASHPTYPERVVRLRAVVREIRGKQAGGVPIMPNIRVRR